MNRIHLAPFPGAGLSAEMRRARVAADLRDRRASIGLWFFVCLALGIAGASFVNQLAAIEAAAKCAAGV